MNFPAFVSDVVCDCLAATTGRPFALARAVESSGGCINRSYVVTGTNGQKYFVKTNTADRIDMFEAEADGLKALTEAKAIATPSPVCLGVAGATSFLVLDYLDLQDAPTSTMEELGRALACLHHVTGDRFGWHRPNYIGSTPQTNTPHADWVGFFIDCRLRPQLELASGRANTLGRLGTQLIDRLPAFFSPYQPVPSLLHGDLWGGNAGATTDARPVMFDPAVYYGDRETDLAMTELFGGFPRRFYDAYRESWPLDDGYAQRKTLYQLYHVLNHFNLFGGGYATQAERMLHRLLSEIR